MLSAALEFVSPLLYGLPRVGMMLTVMSLLPDAIATRSLRAVVATSLLLGIYPLLVVQSPLVAVSLSSFLLLMKELMVGALLGTAIASLFWVMQSVGALIDNQVGTSTAEVLDPFGGHPAGPWSGLFGVLAVALFVAIGGLHTAYTLLAESFNVWPLNQPLISIGPSFAGVGEKLFANVASAALSLAMPVILLLALVELGIGLLNRAAPQLNVFSIAMPVKACLAALVIAVSFPTMLSVASAHLASALELLPVLSSVKVGN